LKFSLGFPLSKFEQTPSQSCDYRGLVIGEIRPGMIKEKCEPWFEVYASAVLHLESERTMERVDAADAAIQARLRYLQYDSDHHEERQLMKDAQRTLSFLRRCP
jgi:hypothetical protein